MSKACDLKGIERWVYDQTHVGIIMADKNLNVLFINSWVESNLQLDVEKVCGANLYKIFPDLSKKNIPQYIEMALLGQVSVLSNRFHKYILPIPLVPGEYAMLDFMQQVATISPRIIEETVAGVMIVIENVTDRVAHEMELTRQLSELNSLHSALEESSRFNSDLLDAIPFGMDIIDETGTILFLNKAIKSELNANPVGQKCWEVYRDDKQQCSDCPLKKSIAIGKISKCDVHGVFGGKTFEVTHKGMIYNGEKAILEIFVDNTERRKVEELVRRNAEMFSELNQASNEMLQLPDLKSIYSFMARYLHQKFPNSIILSVAIDELEQSAELVEVAGPENSMLGKIQKMTGWIFRNKKFKLVPAIYELFRTGILKEFSGGLVAFSSEEFSSLVAESIQKLLNINKIYTIGILNENELLGAIHFFTLRQSEISDHAYIELFVKQAGLLIQNKMIQHEMAKSEKKFRTIFEDAPIGIALVESLNGRLIELNRRFADIIGRPVSELEQIDWMAITHPDDIQEDMDNMARLNAGEIDGFSINKRYLKPDGSIIWGNLTVAKMVVENNNSPRHLAMIEDITERKQNQLQLENYAHELKNANAEKDKFFSIIAHDLRGPFSGIVGLAEFLSENSGNLSSHDLQENMDGLKRSASNTYALLENLLEWSRMQQGMIVYKPEKIDLKLLQMEIFSLVLEIAKNKNIALSAQIPDGLFVQADKDMLATIIRNLLTNAIKFTPSGGKVQFTVAPENKQQIRFTVKDSGIGMKKEILENLFRSDVNVSRPGTNNEPSTGLGLLLCKEFVEKHGGAIWAESEVGVGTTFSFTLKKL